MNIHHLELFYYVARHGGIMEAVRNMPYGIQQPAVSGQIAQLEEHLGVTLFQRRPFKLTPPGEKLYQFIQPFFGHLDTVAAEIQGGPAQFLRIGGSTLVLRDHLPELVQQVRKRYPKLKVHLREGYQADLESALLREELDLAITLVDPHPTPGINRQVLLELPMVLLVHKASKVTDARELWQRDRIEEALICMPAAEIMVRSFQQALSARNVDWFPSIEVTSVDLVHAYVSNGFGIGLVVAVPQPKYPPDVRVLALPDFPTVPVGALWRGKPNSLVQAFLDALMARVKKMTAAAG